MRDWAKQPVKTPVSKQQLDAFCTPHIKNKINSLFGSDLPPEEAAVLSQIFSTDGRTFMLALLNINSVQQFLLQSKPRPFTRDAEMIQQKKLISCML